VIATGRSR